jgi:hypothetical protein
MDTVLGLLGIIVFIAGIISLAVLVTYAVVKLTPPPKPKADGKA